MVLHVAIRASNKTWFKAIDVNSSLSITILDTIFFPPSVPYACCGATIPRLEPLIPVAESHRRVKAPRVSCHSTTRVANMKKKKNVVKEQCSPEDMSKLIEQINDAIETKPSKQKFLNKPRNGLEHPEDCCCVECDENEKTLSGG